MPTEIHAREPVTAASMRIRPSVPGAICDVLYDIYHMTHREDIRLKIRLATAMAKAMNAKLKEYSDAAKRH